MNPTAQTTEEDNERTRRIETLQTCKNIGENAEEHYQFLVEKGKALQKDEDLLYLTRIAQAMRSKDRWLILFLLHEKDRCVCELECALGKTQPAVSRHLKKLKELNLIYGWKDGKFTHYSLAKHEFEKLRKIINHWIDQTQNWFEEVPQRETNP